MSLGLQKQLLSWTIIIVWQIFCEPSPDLGFPSVCVCLFVLAWESFIILNLFSNMLFVLNHHKLLYDLLSVIVFASQTVRSVHFVGFAHS